MSTVLSAVRALDSAEFPDHICKGFQYNISVKRYKNKVHGVRYNISASLPQSRKTPDQVSKFIPTYGGESVGRRVHPLEERDRTSILRAIRNIREIGLSNDWDYFVTFTLDRSKIDRTDHASAMARVSRYFRYLRKEFDLDVQYLLIPELHHKPCVPDSFLRDVLPIPAYVDNVRSWLTSFNVNYQFLVDSYVSSVVKPLRAWHFHGFMKNLPNSLLVPHPLKRLEQKGYKAWDDMSKRFGFVSLSPVKDTTAVVYYCLKYINKDLFSQRLNDRARLYYVSRGVNRPQEVSNFSVEATPSLLNVYGFDVTPFATGYCRSVPEDVKNNFVNQFFFTEEYYKE